MFALSATDLTGEAVILDTPALVADRAATWIARRSALAVAERGRFSICLTGGSSPRTLYTLLAEPRFREGPHAIDWSAWWVYFGDERACPPDDPDSNYHLAQSTLLHAVPIPPDQIYRMPAEHPDLDAAAAAYSVTLQRTLGNPPSFDCLLLGLGENGHIASLFPGSAALAVDDAWCTRGLADYAPFDRMTLTYPALNAARSIAFLVTGGGKGAALRGAIDGSAPAARVIPDDGDLRWFLDRAAADSVNAG